jgi:uncharacterized protein (TIGR02302 family)
MADAPRPPAQHMQSYARDTMTSAGRPDLGVRAAKLVRRSRLALAWERLWPALWLPLSVVFVFLFASWAGVWTALGPTGRMAGVAAFAVTFLASLIQLRGFRWPSETDARARLDRSAPDGHRPASAAADTLGIGAADPVARALWELHQKRQRETLEKLQVSAPSPGMPRLDLRALRFAPLAAAAASLFIAGPEASHRVTAAFDWAQPAPPGPQIRIDAWIDPPPYTRLPPVMLTFAPGEGAIRAPAKSTVIVRISGAPEATVEGTGGLEAQPAPSGVRQGVERRYSLTADGALAIGGKGVPAGRTAITMVPDQPPVIEMTQVPQAGQRGQLTVTFRARDDYGVASIEAGFEPAQPPREGSRPLIQPPRMPLPAGSEAAGEADTSAILEMADHPWAGARVRMRLTARDDAGQEGVSEAREIVLPQRGFVKPLPRALVEVRRWLVMDVMERRRAQTALDALLIEPELFTKEAGTFLPLRAVTEKLRTARGDEGLLEVVKDLWDLAVLLEDGDLSDAERNMRQAQERLQQALERGADQNEISRLTRELREAMDRFMRELAEQMQRDQQQGRQNENAQLPENFRTVTPRDLNNMLDRIEELNRRGETEEAQRLLNELNNIMRNLQMARPGQQDPRQREMQNQLSELDRLTREQQELRDETFQEGQEQRNQRMQPNRRNQQQQQQGQRGQNQPQQRGQQQRGQQQDGQQEGQEGQEGQMGQQGQRGQQQGRDQLAQRQQQLRDRLREMQRRMQGMGVPNQQGLGDAERAMGEADQALGQGDMDGAAEAQGRALEGLRNGANQLAQQMQQEGQGEGEGEGMAEGDPTGNQRDRANSRQSQQRDPLGREGNQREQSRGVISGDTRVPGEAPQVRARRILEELRRRFGDTLRPQDELDYLERLLRRN